MALKTQTSARVFVSYASQDQAFVNKLRRALKARGVESWVDRHELRGGDRFGDRIADAIGAARALLLVLSPHARASEYVAFEWAFAMGAGVKVIPLVLKEAKRHEVLRPLHYIDFTKGQKPWARVVEALATTRGNTGRPPVEEPAVAGQPKICAEFELENGEPRMVGEEYVVDLRIQRVPPDTVSVQYRMHDETFRPDRWTERTFEDGFASWTQSYGDVFVSATLRKRDGSTQVVGTTLYDALAKAHARNKTPEIRRALREIAEN